MEHTEFINTITRNGVSVHPSTQPRPVYEIPVGFNDSDKVVVHGKEVKWDDDNRPGWHGDPFEKFIKHVIDMDSWKHSWHVDVKEQNYEKLKEIIQDKVIQRSEEIKMLMDSYNCLLAKIDDADNG